MRGAGMNTTDRASPRRRILLVYPKLGSSYWFGTYEPLALEILSAIAKEEGCDVSLVDLRFDRKGLDAAHGDFDVVATTTHGYTEVPIVNELLPQLRRRWPQARIAVGGIPATLRPDLFAQDFIDLLVQGPGENLWRSWCRDGFPGGPCQVIRDPRPPRAFSFPTPDRAITAQYRSHYRTWIPNHSGTPFGRTAFTMMTQGCPFRCDFCVIWPANLGMYRKRPIPDIIAELKTIREDYIYLGDDNTFADTAWADKLATAIAAAGIRASFSSYCRVDHICAHPELFERWASIGLRYLVLGVEAVDQARLDAWNKKTEAGENERAFAILRRCGIYAIPHILVSQDMVQADLDRIVDYCNTHRFEYPTLVPLTPLPGTALHDRYRKEGRLLTEDLRRYNFMFNVVKPTGFPSPRSFTRAWEGMYLRLWSLRAWWEGWRGDVTTLAFLRWWLAVRLTIIEIRWRNWRMGT